MDEVEGQAHIFLPESKGMHLIFVARHPDQPFLRCGQ